MDTIVAVVLIVALSVVCAVVVQVAAKFGGALVDAVRRERRERAVLRLLLQQEGMSVGRIETAASMRRRYTEVDNAIDRRMNRSIERARVAPAGCQVLWEAVVVRSVDGRSRIGDRCVVTERRWFDARAKAARELGVDAWALDVRELTEDRSSVQRKKVN